MNDLRVAVTIPPDRDHKFVLTPQPALQYHPNAWRVERDGTFIGYIYKDKDGLYHQFQPAILLMPEIVDILADSIEKEAESSSSPIE